MDYIRSVFEIILIFCGFALIHSVTATDWIKTAAADVFGNNFVRAAYRFLYTSISGITFLIAYLLIKRLHDTLLIEITGTLKILFYLIQAIGLLIVMFSFKQINLFEFIGIKQIVKYIFGKETRGNIEGLTTDSIIRTGMYGMMRHPLYSGSILILVFNHHITLNYTVLSLLCVLYFIIGAYLEELRLKKTFGSQYLDYMKDVPCFIPKIGKKMI
ncbi:MAG: hypothetical protein HQK92_13715 [Nitrospirae bacterium]|nr:hypothetical protein [Nitrospirota bacterium]